MKDSAVFLDFIHNKSDSDAVTSLLTALEVKDQHDHILLEDWRGDGNVTNMCVIANRVGRIKGFTLVEEGIVIGPREDMFQRKSGLIKAANIVLDDIKKRRGISFSGYSEWEEEALVFVLREVGGSHDEMIGNCSVKTFKRREKS